MGPSAAPKIAVTDLRGVRMWLALAHSPTRRGASSRSSRGFWSSRGRSPYPGLYRKGKEQPGKCPWSSSSIWSHICSTAAAAEQYGGLCAAVWTVMPQMEEWLDIRRPAIHMDVDFDAAALRARGRVGASMRIGTLLAIGLGLAVPGLRWLLRFMKAHQSDSKKNGPKESKPRADAPAQEPDAAA